MLDMSPELVLEILDTFSVPLGFPAEHIPVADRVALRSCSLVCKRWAAHSQRLLFRRVVINNAWTGMLLMQRRPMVVRTVDPIASFLETITVDTEKSSWLRNNVLSLVLRPHSSTKQRDIIRILTNLPNLRELDIIGPPCMFNDEELAELRSSAPSIRSLRINAHNLTPIPGPSMGPDIWLAVIDLIKSFPTIRMLDITANAFLGFPEILGLGPPLGLSLLSFKFNSRWVANAGPFLASLVDGCTDNEPLEVFHHKQTKTPPADLHDVLSTHGHHIRSLVIQGQLKDPHVLSLCTRLERFECETLPSDELVAAIPRTITALAVANPTQDLPSVFPLTTVPLPPPRVPFIPVEHLTVQLATFPSLRVLTWMGSTAHSGFAALREQCGRQGIELRCHARNTDIFSDDEVQFMLRRRLLQI
ncbi:hypothetical protein B0H12DRAFT_708127 [Mycena haematopus]|nr:hypothetical protein B0H12DRAFT_708127 [Mycena haematopus]